MNMNNAFDFGSSQQKLTSDLSSFLITCFTLLKESKRLYQIIQQQNLKHYFDASKVSDLMIRQ